MGGSQQPSMGIGLSAASNLAATPAQNQTSGHSALQGLLSGPFGSLLGAVFPGGVPGMSGGAGEAGAALGAGGTKGAGAGGATPALGV